jgi:hypothetical protein
MERSRHRMGGFGRRTHGQRNDRPFPVRARRNAIWTGSPQFHDRSVDQSIPRPPLRGQHDLDQGIGTVPTSWEIAGSSMFWQACGRGGGFHVIIVSVCRCMAWIRTIGDVHNSIGLKRLCDSASTWRSDRHGYKSERARAPGRCLTERAARKPMIIRRRHRNDDSLTIGPA